MIDRIKTYLSTLIYPFMLMLQDRERTGEHQTLYYYKTYVVIHSLGGLVGFTCQKYPWSFI